MIKQITTADIAGRLGISRGTVSKALNDRAHIDERTKRLVQKTASEMGYRKQRLLPGIGEGAASKNILSLLLRESMLGDRYWAFFIQGFEREATGRGYQFTMSIVTPREEEALRLPQSLSGDPPAGIVTIGPLGEAYYTALAGFRIPAVFVDTAPDVSDARIAGDTLLICNRECVREMTAHLIEGGHRRLGFIGDPRVCRSFQERYQGFCDALAEAGLPLARSLVYGVSNETVERTRRWLESLSEPPTAFVCVNDLHALVARTALKELGLSVPQDVALCGFDDDPSISFLAPGLTTIDSRVQYVGKRAAQELFWRMENPDAPREVLKIASSVVYRESTEGYRFT